jgi:hypothetical protein
VAGDATEAAPKGAEKQLLEAISRLRQGKPTHADLKARALEGNLKINPTTATLEACCSRRLAYKYERVRKALEIDQAEVEIAGDETPVPRKGLQQVVIDLRQDKKELQRRLQLAESQNAALVIRLRNMEMEVAKEVRRVQRQMKRGDTASNQIAGNVLRLVPADENLM